MWFTVGVDRDRRGVVGKAGRGVCNARGEEMERVDSERGRVLLCDVPVCPGAEPFRGVNH